MEWLMSAKGLNARQELEASIREHHSNLRDEEVDLIVDGRLLRMVWERAAEQAPASGQQGGIGEGGAVHETPTAVGVGGGTVAPTIDTGMIGTSYSQFNFGVEHISVTPLLEGKHDLTAWVSALAQLRKGDDETVESYCNRARTIRAELLAIGQEVHMATFAAHMLKGLPLEYGFLRRKLDISSPDMTVERVCNEVLMEEQTLSIEQSYKQITSDASAFSGTVKTIVATTGVKGKEGKGGREQTDKKKDGKREEKQGPFKGHCYNCNEEGHMAAKCPIKKKDATPTAAANVAEGDGKGVALTVACSAAKLLADDKDLWFLDSGCSQHMTGLSAISHDGDVAYLAEDDCYTDSDDEVEYPDEDEEEGTWGGVILDLAAALTGPESKEWWAAMKEEMESLDEQGTWMLAELPEGRKTVGVKWLLKKKLWPDGTVEKYKAKLVAKGFSQRFGVDYNDTYAPVGNYTTVRVFLSITVAMDLDLLQLDVKKAFLHGTIDHEIYIQQPPYFTGGSSKVCLLQKSLYWLKHSPLLWYKELDKVLLVEGYKKSLVDQALYYKDGASGKRVWLIIYVDDLLAAMERYLGLQIVHECPNRTLLHPNAYVAKVQQRFFRGAPPKKQPISPLSSASSLPTAKKLQGATKLSSTDSELVVVVEARKEGRKLRFSYFRPVSRAAQQPSRPSRPAAEPPEPPEPPSNQAALAAEPLCSRATTAPADAPRPYLLGL
ncbi:unnamed protein product, partial [Closterium sp. NIES-54]